MLFAASVAGPAFAETLAKPEVTGGEKVKAPKSAPTQPAAAPKPQPTANVKEGGDLVRLLCCPCHPLPSHLNATVCRMVAKGCQTVSPAVQTSRTGVIWCVFSDAHLIRRWATASNLNATVRQTGAKGCQTVSPAALE